MATEKEIRIKRDALLHFCPNGFSSSEDIDTYHCVSDPTPSKSDLDAKIIELTAEWDAQEYARNRAEAYPSIQDQLDYIYHNSITKWKSDMIKPVKDKHPKP